MSNSIRNALYDIDFWISEDDLTGVGAALDVLATHIIRAGIVDSSDVRRRHAQHLSDVLDVILENYEEGHEFLEEAMEGASTLEECVSAHNYGDYAKFTIDEAGKALEILTENLEKWLDELEDET